MVKRASFELLEKEIAKDIPFDETFEKNKKLLNHTMPSKKTRNKIAGYIARLKKAEKKEQ